MAFGKNLYDSIEQLQPDLGIWLSFCNNGRTHQVKMCCGYTPMQTSLIVKWFELKKNDSNLI